jgi:hypothetical protein
VLVVYSYDASRFPIFPPLDWSVEEEAQGCRCQGVRAAADGGDRSTRWERAHPRRPSSTPSSPPLFVVHGGTRATSLMVCNPGELRASGCYVGVLHPPPSRWSTAVCDQGVPWQPTGMYYRGTCPALLISSALENGTMSFSSLPAAPIHVS